MSRSVDFGTVHIDINEEGFNPLEVFRHCLTEFFFKQHNNPEKCCLYLCQLNNLEVDCDDEIPKRISKVNTFLDFTYVIMKITNEYPDENIIDLKLLFSKWIEFLNDSADAIDRHDENRKLPGITFGDYFFNQIKEVLDNEPGTDKGDSETGVGGNDKED